MTRDPHNHYEQAHDPRRYDPPATLGRLQFFALVAGVIGLVLSGLGFFVDPANLVRSYLIGLIYWITIPLGCLGLLMINHMTGGDWGVLGRRVFEAGARTLPLMLVLFLPLFLFGLTSLYPWTLTHWQPVDESHAVTVEDDHAALVDTAGFMAVPARQTRPADQPASPSANDQLDGPAVDGTVIDPPVDTYGEEGEDGDGVGSHDGIAPGDFGDDDGGHGATGGVQDNPDDHDPHSTDQTHGVAETRGGTESHGAGGGIEDYVDTHRDFLEHKEPYLNVPFLWVRLFLYFAVWVGLSFLLNRLSARQDAEPRPALTKRMQTISAPGLILLALTVSFAAYDWLMSLYPTWFSTMYGVYFIGTMGLSALAFLILVGNFLRRTEPWDDVFQSRIFHDYGKLLLAFVVLWAYFSISQFLIIWAGNLPDEIAWFLPRFSGGWLLVTTLLFIFHFGIPFVLLLSRDLKEKARLLGMVAAFILVMRFVDLVWQVAPTIQSLWHVPVGSMWWMALGTVLLIGGIWMWFFVFQLKRRPLLPVNDPYLEEALVHGHAH